AAPRYAIIGEPTTMQVIREHKAINSFRTTVTGKAAHSSQPHRGAGAIFAAARIIEKLHDIGQFRRQAAIDSGCEPPWTTVQVGTIHGGTAVNILPAHCEFGWEYRSLPDEDPERVFIELQQYIDTTVLPTLQEFAPDASIETEVIARVPPLQPAADDQAERWVQALDGVRGGGSGAVSFATEAGIFQQAGIRSIVCGPGSIDQAHQPNEFIDPAELTRCEAMVDAVFEYLYQDG
ncbi:MAG: M20/M25/M40 family metallo-hydrolase, partial [Pseudomonadota bacterium]